MKIYPLQNLTHRILWPQKFLCLPYSTQYSDLALWTGVSLTGHLAENVTIHLFISPIPNHNNRKSPIPWWTKTCMCSAFANTPDFSQKKKTKYSFGEFAITKQTLWTHQKQAWTCSHARENHAHPGTFENVFYHPYLRRETKLPKLLPEGEFQGRLPPVQRAPTENVGSHPRTGTARCRTRTRGGCDCRRQLSSSLGRARFESPRQDLRACTRTRLCRRPKTAWAHKTESLRS